MNIPYRTQQRLKRLGVVLLVAALVFAVFALCWFLWLDRYVVYTRDGVQLDFERSTQQLDGEPAVPPSQENLIGIYYNEGDAAVSTSTELSQMIGYYIDEAALLKGIEDIKVQLDALPVGTPVMLEVKNSFGSAFYNSSTIPYRTDSLDHGQVDELIRFMNQQGLYTIACLPSLRDYCFGLDHEQNGLPTSGGWLWADEEYRYWLDPTKEGTISYLTDVANELRVLGFNEVVFMDFHFPDTDSIVFPYDKKEALENTAKTLLATCGTSTFAVSFETTGEFTLPEGRSRIYKTQVDAIAAKDIAEASGVADTAIQLVFVTDLYDTRFNEYSVLRPLSFAE